MNKKRILIICICLLLVLATVSTGVFFWLSTGEKIVPAENVYAPKYESFSTYEHDPEITIDGVLDESVWQDKKWFSNTYLANAGGSMPSVTLTGFATEYGVYIASVAKDSNLVNDGQRSPGKNSNWELYVTADNVGEERPNDTVYRRQFNIDMTGDAYTVYPNFDRAVKVEGILNSGDTTSATLEMFIPWQLLQIDVSKGVPEDFRVMIGYRAVLPGQSGTTLLQPVNYPIAATKDYYAFDSKGYVNADRTGAVLGDSVFGNSKTANWDLSREAEGIVESATGTEHHKLFFTGEYGGDYIVETTMIPVKSLNNEWPKAGIFFQGTDGLYSAVFLDMNDGILVDSVNGTKNFGRLQLVTLNNNEGKWNQSSLSKFNAENPNAATQEGVKLTVIKSGSRFWYFIDGRFVTCEDKPFMDIDVMPGLYALGGDVIYKDYSCKPLTEASLTEYLVQNGLYLVEANVGSAGGSVSASAFTVAEGGSYQLTIHSNTGYEVSSVLINGEECIENVKKSAIGGVYTVNGVTQAQQVRVLFSKTEGVKLTGVVYSEDNEAVSAQILLTGVTNPALRYALNAAGDKGYTVTVPTGTYQMTVTADGFETAVATVNISEETTRDYVLKTSGFAESVKVNNKVVTSLIDRWDLSNSYLGKVSTSFAAGGKIAPLYFSKTGVDFVMETTIDYTSLFQSGIEYQPDLMGGFVFSDGTSQGWIVARGTGIVTTGWKFTHGLVDYSMLMYPSKQTAHFAVAKRGNEVNIYFDGELAGTMLWSEIAPNIDAGSELALGLYMIADKTADIQFSNYRVLTGSAAVDQYISDHVSKDASAPSSDLFAKAVTVNGVQLKSLLKRWEVSGNTAAGSFALGTKTAPLYFNTHGSTALISATIEYTTEFVSGTDYQKDLMGGFLVSDGENSGWIMANRTGIVYTGWKFEHGLVKDAVLMYPEKRSVEMTMAISDGYAYVFFDDTLICRKKLSLIIPGAADGADFAYGLYMVTDKAADVCFSNVSISTDASTVQSYITENQ